MKIREVCRRTGLTERTVRYWASEGLIAPATYELNERSYFDFSEADIRLLETISILRRVGFSVAEVGEMQKTPDSIPTRASALRDALQTQAEEQQRSAEALAAAEGCTDLYTLAQRLSESAACRPLPELNPHFGRFDMETAEERKERYRAFLSASAHRRQKKQILLTAVGAALLVLLSVFSTLAATRQLPKAPPRPVLTWEERISGDFPPPFAVVCEPGTALKKAGTNVETGTPVMLFSADGQEVTLFFRRIGEAEQEFLTEADQIWRPAPGEGAHDALCYLPAGAEWYEIHAVGESVPSEALPNLLNRCLKLTATVQTTP